MPSRTFCIRGILIIIGVKGFDKCTKKINFELWKNCNT